MANDFFKDKRGGARAGGGRKKMTPDERKIQVRFYVRAKNANAFKAAGEALLKEIDGA